MKNFKKIASAIAALSLAACVAVPMSATVFTASAITTEDGGNTVTVTATDNATHEYEAFQVFSGTYDTGLKTLTGIDWGDGVDGTALLNALTSDTTLNQYFNADTCKTASDVAKILSDTETGTEEKKKVFDEDNDLMQKFADIVAANLKKDNVKQTSGKVSGNTISNLPDGYYLIQDSKAPEKAVDGENSGAKTRFILKAVGGETVTVKAKQAAPSVDKLVWDETGDAEAGNTDGWGETADHAINETFQFKLNAQLPNEAEIEKYKSYKLVFTDTLSAGVDINTNPNMKIYLNGTTESVVLSPKPTEGVEPNAFYEITENGKKITVTIKDVKALDKFTDAGGKLQNLLVSVVYDAHLNENAIVSDSNLADTTTYNAGENANINNNKVSLKYSNNPNQTGSGEPELGQTPEDTVGVFTYKVTNSKVDSVEKTKKLAGATFELYDTNPTTDGATPLNLVAVSGKEGCYRLATDDETASASTTITTVADKDFIFYGLDAGTYYLKETKAPDGYNSLGEAVKIEIKATHAENSAETGASLTLNSTDNKSTYNEEEVSQLKGEIENAKGATLPSTGGIGTTLFYLGGGALVAVAGVMLITKKRMTKE